MDTTMHLFLKIWLFGPSQPSQKLKELSIIVYILVRERKIVLDFVNHFCNTFLNLITRAFVLLSNVSFTMLYL